MTDNSKEVFINKKILIVEDDMRNIFSLSFLLEERGVQILTAENGKEALEVLNKHPHVNLILMDIMMPEMDGYQAMIEIRKQKEFKNLPIIALTAKAMQDDRQKCIEAGANDYLSKPVDIDKLLSRIEKWL